MDPKKQQEILEELFGCPLPVLDPVYTEPNAYSRMSPNYLITPYLLSEVYTVEEMKMVQLMPATAEQIAQKLGLDTEHCVRVLENMLDFARIVSTNKANPKVYSHHLNMVAFRDSLGLGFLSHKMDWTPKMRAFRLMDHWIHVDYSPMAAELVKWEMRVIPKWESIKDIPGVMYCENAKEIMERNVRAGTMLNVQCVCRAYRSYLDEGKHDPDHCAELHEHSAEDGHCFSFGSTAEFYKKKYPDSHLPNMDEAMELLKSGDESRCIYQLPNTRETTQFCSCCTDCCAVSYHYEAVGIKDVRKPSRFRPYWREEKCVGCQVCETRCHYDAIQVVDGAVVIHEDLCKGCGNCVVTCPTKALKMKIVHGPEWIPDVPYIDGWSVHDELEGEENRKAAEEQGAKISV